MKKLIGLAIAGCMFAPFLVSAQTVPFSTDLHYGSTGSDVTALQEFLAGQGVFTGNATGNFYSKTLAAVKKFQAAEGITPVSGYVGPITRGAINSILTEQAPQSEGNATTTKPIVDLSKTAPVIPAPVQPVIPSTINTPVQNQPVQTQNQQPTQPQIQFGSTLSDCSLNLVAEVDQTDGTATSTSADYMFIGTSTVAMGCSIDMSQQNILQTPSVRYTGGISDWLRNGHIQLIPNGFVFTQSWGGPKAGTFVWTVGTSNATTSI